MKTEKLQLPTNKQSHVGLGLGLYFSLMPHIRTDTLTRTSFLVTAVPVLGSLLRILSGLDKVALYNQFYSHVRLFYQHRRFFYRSHYGGAGDRGTVFSTRDISSGIIEKHGVTEYTAPYRDSDPSLPLPFLPPVSDGGVR